MGFLKPFFLPMDKNYITHYVYGLGSMPAGQKHVDNQQAHNLKSETFHFSQLPKKMAQAWNLQKLCP